jgi:hypothetical protein
MRSPLPLAIATLLWAGAAGPAAAQGIPPIPLARFPHIAIISPVFFWEAKVDVVRTVSATCPQGRPIAGGISVQRGNGSFRIRESFPDGSSWVIRVVNRREIPDAQPLQVRAFAVCLLPVARTDSMQITQYPRLLHLSRRFALPPGDVTTAERQACAQNALVISGGMGLDPEFKGQARPRLELSYPDKWGWNIRTINGVDSGQPGAEARVHGVCLGTEEGLNIQNYQTVQFAEATVTVKPGQNAVRQSVRCREPSAHAIAGGARVTRGANASIEIQESFPDAAGSWTVAVANPGAGAKADAAVALYAICIAP